MDWNNDILKDYGLMCKAYYEELEKDGLVEIDNDEEMGFTTYSILRLESEKGRIEMYFNCILSYFVINHYCEFRIYIC